MESILLAGERVSVNDGLAYILMERKGMEGIYIFDRHFENLNVKVLYID